jgi:two-component system cell cycle sensor histidine kinase/response regulator CckA
VLNERLTTIFAPEARWQKRRAFAFATLITFATFGLRIALDDEMGQRPMLVLFIIPVLAGAQFGGLWAGILSTALAALLTKYYFFSPGHSFAFTSALDLAQWLIFILCGALISLMTGAMHRRTYQVKTHYEALRRTEAQFFQSQKNEEIGRLAGGVAHDFNNILSIILCDAALCAEELDPGHPAQQSLEQITKAADRAAALSRQLLAFSRRQILDPKHVHLGEVIEGMHEMFRRTLGEDVEMATQADPNLGIVRVDAPQFEQVLLNLVINARDAMPEGGKLSIEARNVQLEEDYVREHPEVQPGPHVMVAVSDTGVGMDTATLRRAYEPFFTTKAPGKGTGLGLSTVQGIVKQSAGSIWIYSEPGRGTAVKLYFPMVSAEKDPLLKAAQGPLRRGTETILVAEDDEQVRRLACKSLAKAGYRVLEARSGAHALEQDSLHSGPVDLLLSDVVMPQMGGRQLAEAMRGRRPGIRVLFMSGYTENSIVHHGILDQGVFFLQKPFTPELLARKVREVLDGLA